MTEHVFHSHCCRADGSHWAEGDPSLRFPWWSFSKTVIAILAMKLTEEGVLDLDAPLPDLPVTMRQLLTHRSGLANYGALPAYHAAVAAGEPPWPRQVILERVLALGPLFAPDEGWSYSNIGYMLAVEHLERITGHSLAEIFDTRIARPLALESARFAATAEDFAALPWLPPQGYHPGWVYHRCLTGSAQDAAQLLHALFTGEMLTPDTLAEMRIRQPLGGVIEHRPWTTHGYAIGLMSGEMRAVGHAAGHSGAGPFSVCAVYHFPDMAMPTTVASFTNGHNEAPVEFRATHIALRLTSPQR